MTTAIIIKTKNIATIEITNINFCLLSPFVLSFFSVFVKITDIGLVENDVVVLLKL